MLTAPKNILSYKGPSLLGLMILISFIVKFVIAANTELTNDEVYYWTYALKLQWNYFDHPPAIAVLIRLSTLNLIFDSELMLRLGPIVCATISTWLIYQIGLRLKDQQTGLFSALLFIASPYSNIMAGMLLLPDAPQMVFWLWTVLLFIQIVQTNPVKPDLEKRLIIIGITIGLCILCKVHGIYLWIGFFLFAILFNRSLFRNKYFYFAIIITVIFILPIVYWNFSNDFITYRYHGNRVNLFGHFQLDSFVRELTGEIIYNNPINTILLIVALFGLSQHKRYMALPGHQLLLCISLPLIATVWFIALFNDTLPHWTGPAYTTLIPLTAAAILSRQQKMNKTGVPLVLKAALALTLSLLIIAFCMIRWLPVNIGSKDFQELGHHDVSLDMSGFKKFATSFDSLYDSDIATGKMKEGSFLIADYWFPAAHFDYYVAKPAKINFLAIGGLSAIHHYAWLNKERAFLKTGDDAYFISVSNYFNPPAASLSNAFESISSPVAITQYRDGIAVRNFFVYRCKNYIGTIPLSGVVENAPSN